MVIHSSIIPNQFCNRIKLPIRLGEVVVKNRGRQVNVSKATAAKSLVAIFAAAAVFGSTMATATATAATTRVEVEVVEEQEESETLSNIPQTLSGECEMGNTDCKKPRIQKPKSRKAERCTSKCVTTCILGGDGSPGEGPFNVRRPLIVFKEGFRSRRYCLVECSDICNIIGDGDDGP
ncbi:hypothetical protein UlMin_041748 [Ulmus minor]